MQLKAMLTDDDAVSPVIGVILMVAITVILAAVIASFVLGLGPGEATPKASFDFEGDSGTIEVTHTQGEKIEASQLSVQFENTTSGESDTLSFGASDDEDTIDDGSGTVLNVEGSEVGSGSTVRITGVSGSEYDVSVIYDGGDQTATLDSGTVTP